MGTTVVVTAKCQAGHIFKFASSREVNDVYANNLQAAAAILLSGNNFNKINRMAEFLGLSFLSESTFHQSQLSIECNGFIYFLRSKSGGAGCVKNSYRSL